MMHWPPLLTSRNPGPVRARRMLRVQEDFLLPFEEALSIRRRLLPPAIQMPLTREERVDLFSWRIAMGFALWNPDDDFDHDPMSPYGFAGEDREDNGTDNPNPEFTSIEAMADAIALRRQEQSRNRKGHAA